MIGGQGRIVASPALKLRMLEIGVMSYLHAPFDYLDVSGPLWVSRIGKEDSTLSAVKVRNSRRMRLNDVY